MAIRGTYTPDDLITGKFPIKDDVIIVPSGTAAFKRGCVLTTAFVPVLTATAANVRYVALEDTDASAAAARCVVAKTGGFNINKMSTGDTTTVVSLVAALEKYSIFPEAAETDTF
ncbi:hypothetical protein FACS1894110_09810 [Spirochaetia bacterium]|nr:hypothetical protein FACS1894110_09810 [Spirochaetia bacterium]